MDTPKKRGTGEMPDTNREEVTPPSERSAATGDTEEEKSGATDQKGGRDAEERGKWD